MQLSFDLAEAWVTLQPLALFTGGITAYGLFVLHFYRFLARRDILTFDLDRHGRRVASAIFHTLRVLLLFPLCVFFWFVVMVGLLLVMGQTGDDVILVAMGVVAAIRVSAYYNETLSTDIAKVVPLGLLGILLLHDPLAGAPDPVQSARDVAARTQTLLYYLCGVVVLETALWAVSSVLRLARRSVE